LEIKAWDVALKVNKKYRSTIHLMYQCIGNQGA